MDLLVHNLQCSDVKCSCASFKFYLFLRCETEPYRQRRYPACVGTWHTMELCMSVYISKFRWVLLKRETWLWQGDILCSRFAVLKVISFHFIHTCENSRYTNGVTYHNGGSGEWQNFISIFKNSEICKGRLYPYIYVLKNYLNISNKILPCTSFHNDASTRGVTKMTACISTVYLLLRLLGQQGMVMQLKAKCHPHSSLVNNKISENSKNVDILWMFE